MVHCVEGDNLLEDDVPHECLPREVALRDAPDRTEGVLQTAPSVGRMSRVLVVIPARFGATRFPGKPLELLWGKPMVQHVWEKCTAANQWIACGRDG